MSSWTDIAKGINTPQPQAGASKSLPSRKVRAQILREELDRDDTQYVVEGSNVVAPTSGTRLFSDADNEKFRADRAQYITDQRMKASLLPTGREMSERQDAGSVAGDMNAYQRIMTSGAARGSRPLYKLGEYAGLWDADDPERFSHSFKSVGDAASEKSSGIAENLASGVVGLVSDPVWLATYGKGRMALGKGVGSGSRWGFSLADDVIAGVGADFLSSGLRSDFDLGGEMQTEVGLGAAGAVGGDLLLRGIGKAWSKFFPDKAPPASAAEAKKILDEQKPGWDAESRRILESELKARKQDALDTEREYDILLRGNREANATLGDAAKRRAEEIIPDEVMNAPEPVYGVETGLERFQKRQARAAAANRPSAVEGPRPEVEADVAARQLEADELRAEALKDPDVVDEIAQLEAAGMTRAEAEALAIPELGAPNPLRESPQSSAKQPWEMTRKEFIKDSETTPKNNKMDEPSPNKYKEGDLVIDGYGDNPYVYQMQRVNPNDLSFNLEGEELSRVVNMPTTKRYIEWFKQGIDPPPIDVVIKDSGVKHSTNRRRVVAAREAGVTDIPAFVEIGRHKSMVQRALAEGRPVPAEVLKDYPDLAPLRKSRREMGSTTIIPDLIHAGIKSGQWTTRHTLSAARWALDVAGDAINTMRDFTRVLMEKFGRGIRQHIPAAWQRFKKFRAQQNAMRQATAYRRQFGGIDLRKRTQQPDVDPGREFPSDGVTAGIKRTGRMALRGFDNLTLPITDKLDKISPRLKNRLYRYDTQARDMKHQLRSIVDPIMHSREIKGLSKQNRNVLKSALLNGDIEKLGELTDALPENVGNRLTEMYTESRRILDDLFDEMQAVGMDIGYMKDMWPRRIKPGRIRELRESLSGKQRDRLDDALGELALQKYNGRKALIPPDEVAAVYDRVVSGYGPRGLDSSKPSIGKHRRVKTIPDNQLHHYEDFDASLDSYIEKASKEIAKRRMLGGSKKVDLDNMENLAGSIGRLIDEYNIRGEDADDVIDIMQSLFHGGEVPLGRGTRAARSLTYILTMGQVQSAVRQIEDMATIAGQATVTSHYNYADVLKATYRTLLKKNEVDMLDLGLDRIVEEYTTSGSQKMVDLTFKLTGLRFIDRKIKNVAIDSALLGGQRQARKNPEALRKILAREFGEEDAAKLVEDLANGDFSENLMVYLSTRLGDIQPVTGLEVPQGYFRAREALPDNDFLRGAPVLFYQLRTFTARRFGLIRREALDEMAAGLADMVSRGKDTKAGAKRFLKGARNLMALLSIYIAAGSAVDQGIEAMNGRDTPPEESLADAALQVIGQNRYTVQQTERSGSSGFTSSVAPASGPTLWQILTDMGRVMDGKRPLTADRVPHMKTFKVFMGETPAEMIWDGGDGRSRRPDRPERPERPAR